MEDVQLAHVLPIAVRGSTAVSVLVAIGLAIEATMAV